MLDFLQRYAFCVFKPAIVILFLGLAACSKQEKQPSVAAEPVSSEQRNIVATVNGEAITDADIEFMLNRMFSDSERMLKSSALRQKVLDSLISSRAMQQAALKELSSSEISDLEKRVAAYREELLVQEYLKRHAEPKTVTAEMVRSYYEKHPHEFGAHSVHKFELLQAPPELNESEQQSLLAFIPKIRQHADWANKADSWRQQYRLHYQAGSAHTGLLQQPLDSALTKLDPGETSDVIYLEGQLNLIRLVTVEELPPKPLSEVSRDIRRKLAPMQLRESVREVSDLARANADVVIQ